MPAKLHPADAAAARIIGRASRFEIALFRGQGRYAKADAATLVEARKAAARLEAEVANGRTDDLRHHPRGPFGPRHTSDPASHGDQSDATDLSTKFNARRAAEKAGTPGDRIEVTKTPEGYSWRVTPGASAASETIAATEPASPAKAAKAKRDRAPSAPVTPAVSSKPRQRANFEALEASARAGNLPAAGFQRGDPRPVPGQAGAPRRSRGGGRCREPTGVHDQSGVVEPEGDGAVSGPLRDRPCGSDPLAAIRNQGQSTFSISLGRHSLVKNGSSGLTGSA